MRQNVHMVVGYLLYINSKNMLFPNKNVIFQNKCISPLITEQRQKNRTHATSQKETTVSRISRKGKGANKPKLMMYLIMLLLCLQFPNRRNVKQICMHLSLKFSLTL